MFNIVIFIFYNLVFIFGIPNLIFISNINHEQESSKHVPKPSRPPVVITDSDLHRQDNFTIDSYNPSYKVEFIRSSSDKVKSEILKSLQGKWYGNNGEVVLNFQGNTLNGRRIIDIASSPGSLGRFQTVIRVENANGNGYKDIPVRATAVRINSNHTRLFVGDFNRNVNGIILLRTPYPRFHYSLDGIGIDCTTQELLDKFGKPDAIVHSEDGDVWIYDKLMAEFAIQFNRIYIIRINGENRLKEENGNYDVNIEKIKTGFYDEAGEKIQYTTVHTFDS